MKKRMTFEYRSKISIGIIILLVLGFALTSTLTLAFFYASDWSNGLINMTGGVNIEAVGDGHYDDPDSFSSIEDTHTSNLVVSLGNGEYSVLIPGMEVTLNANCKVYRSSTSPLLRAKIDFDITDVTGVDLDEEDFLVSDIYGNLLDIVESNGWYLHTDSYFYYLGDIIQPNGATYGNQIMKEVDVTMGDKVIPFIDQPFKLPTSISSSYSGDRIKFKITFQAIQNFIADKSTGNRLDNTITNSLIIFDDFNISYSEETSLDYFTVSFNSNSQYEINLAPGKVLPEVVVLPTHDTEGHEITHIGSTFNGSTTMKSLTVPETYTTMAPSAFQGCVNLVTADLEASKIKTLQDSAFYNSSKLRSIELPHGLISLYNNSLRNTHLESINLPETVTSLGENSLTFIYLKSLYIPKNVSAIYGNSISSTSWSTVIVDEENPYYKDIDNKFIVSKDGTQLIKSVYILGEDTMYIPDGIINVNSYSINGLSSSTTRLYISEDLEVINSLGGIAYNITKIDVHPNNRNFYADEDAFYNYARTSILKFLKKGYDELHIPDSVTSMEDIGDYVVNKLYIGKGLTIFYKGMGRIGQYIVDDENPYIQDVDNGLVILSKDGTVLQGYASNNSAIEYTIPDSVKIIRENAFNRARYLVTINFNNVNRVAYNSFTSCISLKNIITPTPISFNGGIFHGSTSLEHVELNATNIGDNLFINCSELKTVVLKDTLTTIGQNVFQNCTSLEYVEFQGVTPPTFTSGTLFSGASSTWVIYVPDSAVDAYKALPQLANYVNRILPVSQKPRS